MVFTELRFLPFLLLTLLVHWSLRSDRSRKIWLLLCSYAFYAAWDWRFLGLILLSTGVDHLAGSNIARSRDPITRLRWLRFSLASNLGVLGIFKYLDFFLESTSVFLTQLGLPTELPALRILLPVGISFYTFQTLSYTLDIYRGKLKPAKGILDLALYVAFFPQLVAGPIVRSSPSGAASPRWTFGPARPCSSWASSRRPCSRTAWRRWRTPSSGRRRSTRCSAPGRA